MISQHIAFVSSISQGQEPTNYLEAIKISIWCKAMEEELNALEKKTWVIM
jgi:hypothetical protein